MLKGLPQDLQEQVLRARQNNWVMGQNYGSNEFFNEHLDRTALLMTLRRTPEGMILGTGNKKIDQQLWLEEIMYHIRCLDQMREECETSLFKFFKKKNYNKLRINTINMIQVSQKELKKAELNKLISLVPPELY